MPLLTRSTWIKIILISALCLVLCGGLISCSGKLIIAGHHAGDISERIQRSMNFSERGDFTIPAQDVQSLEIVWLAGGVNIEVVEDEAAKDDAGNLQITGTESYMGAGFPMTWQVSDGMLQVSYSSTSGLISCSSIGEKRLVLTLPKSVARSLKLVNLMGTSGTYQLGPIACEQLNVDLASGRVEGGSVNARAVDLDVASGDVQLSGAFTQNVDVDLASGNIRLTCPEGCPSRTSLDVASGEVTLSVPADSGITASVDRLSGSFNCDLPGGWNQTGQGATVFGDGTNSLDVNLASGTINIRAL